MLEIDVAQCPKSGIHYVRKLPNFQLAMRKLNPPFNHLQEDLLQLERSQASLIKGLVSECKGLLQAAKSKAITIGPWF